MLIIQFRLKLLLENTVQTYSDTINAESTVCGFFGYISGVHEDFSGAPVCKKNITGPVVCSYFELQDANNTIIVMSFLNQLRRLIYRL